MKTRILPTSLMEKITSRTPDATPNEVLWGAAYGAERAAERLNTLVESMEPQAKNQAVEQIMKDCPDRTGGSVRERIIRLREIRDYYNEVAAQIEREESK